MTESNERLRDLVFRIDSTRWIELRDHFDQLPQISPTESGLVRVAAAARGGRVDLTHAKENPELVGLVLDGPVELACELPQITQLYFEYGFREKDPDKIKQLLARLPNLQTLDFGEFGVGIGVAVDMDWLPNPTALRNLRIDSQHMCDTSCESLARVSNLERLLFSAWTELSVAPLSQLTELKLLELEWGKNIIALRGLGKLEHLKLSETSTISNLKRFELPRLRGMTLCQHVVRSLEGLGSFRQLEHLELRHTRVESLAPISELPTLTTLVLQNHRAFKGLEQLKTAPLRRVVIDNRASPEYDLSNLTWIHSFRCLEDAVLDVRIANSDLSPTFKLPNLRRIKLFGQFRSDDIACLESNGVVVEVQIPADATVKRGADSADNNEGDSEHGLLIYIPMQASAATNRAENDAIFDLEDRLAAVVERAGYEYDGHTIGPSEVVLYMYGEDADTLLETVLPLLKSCTLPAGAWAIKQYGPPSDDVRTERVDL